jgi:hypothetical protein
MYVCDMCNNLYSIAVTRQIYHTNIIILIQALLHTLQGHMFVIYQKRRGTIVTIHCSFTETYYVSSYTLSKHNMLVFDYLLFTQHELHSPDAPK